MFTHYIGNEAATRAAFDTEGYYKTGDRGRLVGDQYFLMVEPTTIDSILALESSNLRDGLVAALVRISSHNAGVNNPETINLQKIRDHLAKEMDLYKLQILLRILKDEDQIPLTDSGKAIKREMLQRYFHITDYMPQEYTTENVEYCGKQIDVAKFQAAILGGKTW
ncbi:hypothetical protein TWF694_000766 [Orbilia ellipsospora]|uniref:AMP-dependent synthetase/ligase domain-containing protein n=1 Tax=Orbilia ellipsospora TaxID=2528407 RepID=A0AAV9XW81_9PEZI